MAARWIKGSKLSNKQIGHLIDYFALEVPAIKAAGILDINRHSAERVYNFIRQLLVSECEKESPLSNEPVPPGSDTPGEPRAEFGAEINEDIQVFGIVIRGGRAYTRSLYGIPEETVRRIIRSHTIPARETRSESLGSFDALALGGTKHFLIRHAGEEAADRDKHRPASADNFWSFVKTKLNRYYGVRGPRLNLYLKEMEFRYNHRSDDLRKVIRDILKKSH
jgi:transposase